VFEKWFGKKIVPLTGAPPVRRLKSYSAASGYVYQYAYEGQRTTGAGIEYVFSASADRKTWADVSVRVGADAVRDWEREHGRELSATEWYALAKMSLFAAFDERADPAALRAEPVIVRAADVAGIIETLGLE
jgi:hypothetical protein